MKMNRRIAIFAIASVCCLAVIRAAAPRKGTFSFDLRDKRSVITADLSRDLELRITRERHATVDDFGWALSVVRKPYKSGRKNLLRHSPETHGPFPTDVFAWISRDHYFPDQRVFDVSHHPMEVALALDGVTTESKDGVAYFTGGQATVTWRSTGRPAPVIPGSRPE